MTARKAPARRPAAKKVAPSAAAARQAEAEDGYVTVEQCGVELRMPLKGHIALSAIERFRAGDAYGGTKEMIGEEQFQLLVEAGATDGDLNELAGKLNGASGN